MLKTLKLFLVFMALLATKQSLAHVEKPLNNEDSGHITNVSQDASSLCMESFNETRARVMSSTTQSVIVLTGDSNISPYITLQSSASNGNHYVLWQSLNGDVRGYALRNGKGFDYTNSALNTMPLTWHPTLIWDNLFGSQKELKNYSCVLTGRTRVMGKRVSLIRLIPQEGLRFSFILAKEDESDFPVELTIIDSKGIVASRLTTMESRIIGGIDFPIKDSIFENALSNRHQHLKTNEQDVLSNKQINSTNLKETSKIISDKVIISNDLSASHELSTEEKGGNKTSLGEIVSNDNQSAGASLNKDGSDSSFVKSISEQEKEHLLTGVTNEQELVWPELNIPSVYNLVAHGKYIEGGPECIYQEFSDGITSFRVYRNKRSSIFYPVLTNGSLSIFRKNSINYEYSVVGEVPLSLSEYVLTKVRD